MTSRPSRAHWLVQQAGETPGGWTTVGHAVRFQEALAAAQDLTEQTGQAARVTLNGVTYYHSRTKETVTS